MTRFVTMGNLEFQEFCERGTPVAQTCTNQLTTLYLAKVHIPEFLFFHVQE